MPVMTQRIHQSDEFCELDAETMIALKKSSLDEILEDIILLLKGSGSSAMRLDVMFEPLITSMEKAIEHYEQLESRFEIDRKRW